MPASSSVTPARLAFRADSTPCALDYADVYHPDTGALAQSRHVFLQGSGLPHRWAGRTRFVILEAGFGLGHNFLATWDAWRRDPQRCERLIFVSIEKHPLTRDDIQRLHATSELPDLAAQLIAAWPHPTPDVHLLDFEEGRVQLMLALGDITEVVPSLQLTADAFFLDGFSPAQNGAMWRADLLGRMTRLARVGTSIATWTCAQTVCDGLSAAGFQVEPASGFASERNMLTGRFLPRHVAPPPRAVSTCRPEQPNATTPETDCREALVIGAGLAGCAAVHGLALQGWRSTLVDARPSPAEGTSSNPGGLFHAVFNAPDSLHARWFRAGADLAQRIAGPAITRGDLAGDTRGFLRLESRTDADQARGQIERVGSIAEVVQWTSQEQAQAASGLPVPSGGWTFAQGGWLSPAAYCRVLLAAADALVPHQWIGSTHVARLERRDGLWRALDVQGTCVAQAPVVVLANALDAHRLLHAAHHASAGHDNPLSSAVETPDLPLSAVRGQTSVLPAGAPHVRPPRMPLSGQGYALQLPDGRVLVGATTQHHDDDPQVRDSDHRHNLRRAAALGVVPTDLADAPEGTAPLEGRVGWRATTPDRLPLIGPVVDAAALTALRTDPRQRLNQLAQLPRVPGLHVLTGLGSRGLTSAALAGRVLAAWITGSPCPVPDTLRDAVDPARIRVPQAASRHPEAPQG